MKLTESYTWVCQNHRHRGTELQT